MLVARSAYVRSMMYSMYSFHPSCLGDINLLQINGTILWDTSPGSTLLSLSILGRCFGDNGMALNNGTSLAATSMNHIPTVQFCFVLLLDSWRMLSYRSSDAVARAG